MPRPLLLLCLLALPAVADERLGTLLRWYLAEASPSRREDLLQAVEKLAGGDPAVVAKAIREGAYLDRPAAPALLTEAPPPSFDGRRVDPLPLDKSAGHFAILRLPEAYDPSLAWPLILDLGTNNFPAAPDVIFVKVKALPVQFPQGAQAAESMLLGLLAHLGAICNVDAERVYLQGELESANLAWYVAFHNPDRFAGVLTALGGWEEAAALAPNARTFGALAVEPRGNSAVLRRMLDAIGRENPLLTRLRRPEEDRELLAPFREWRGRTARPPPPSRIVLVLDRPDPIRCFWLRAAPRVRSEQKLEFGQWIHRGMRSSGAIEAELDQEGLVRVKASGVTAFELHLDPALFPARTLRVSINGGVPETRVVVPSIGDLLEDFRERRDPGILSFCKLSFGVRGR